MKVLSNFFKKVINDYRQHREIKATINELQKLTNKELNDIGLSRGDIYHVAHDAIVNNNLKGWV